MRTAGMQGSGSLIRGSNFVDPFGRKPQQAGPSRKIAGDSGDSRDYTPQPAVQRLAPTSGDMASVNPTHKRRGSGGETIPVLDDDTREELMAAYQREKFAKTSHGTRDSLLAIWARMLHVWHGEAVPLVPV